jgi:hypothetical protein
MASWNLHDMTASAQRRRISDMFFGILLPTLTASLVVWVAIKLQSIDVISLTACENKKRIDYHEKIIFPRDQIQREFDEDRARIGKIETHLFVPKKTNN